MSSSGVQSQDDPEIFQEVQPRKSVVALHASTKVAHLKKISSQARPK